MATGSRHPLHSRAALLDELATTLGSQRSCVVVAEPGMGLTWLLSRLAADLDGELRVQHLVATRSAATVPLGLFLPLLDRDASTLALAARLRERIVAERAIVIVDDAHLVDPASAALLFELARGRGTVACGVRPGNALPDALAAMERLPAVQRYRVPPMTGDDLVRFVRQELGVAPDPALVGLLARRCGGVPELVQEMLALLRHEGRIQMESRTAFLGPPSREARVGEPPGLGRLFARTDPAALHAARLVALAGELPEPTVRQLCRPAAIEAAEADGLIAVHLRDEGADLAPRYPFLSEALSISLRPSTRLALLQQLLAVPHGSEGGAATAREVRWRIELGEKVDAHALLDAAASAQASAPDDADRLLDAALSRVLTPDRRLRLAHLLVNQHRLDDAETLLAELCLIRLTPTMEHERDLLLAALLAALLAFPGNEPARAEALLVADGGADALRSAQLAAARLQRGEIGDAISGASEVFSDRSAPLVARAHASLTLGAALLHAGRGREYEQIRKARQTLIGQTRSEIPDGAEAVLFLDEMMLLEHREVVDAAYTLAHAARDRALDRGDDGASAQHAHLLARVALERGMPQQALVLATAATISDGPWARTVGAWTSATRVEALVLGGAVGEASELLARLRARGRSPLYDVDVARAEAVAQAAVGDVAGAGDALARAAAAAIARGQITRGRYTLEQAVRFRSSAASRALLRLGGGGEATARAQRLARAWLDADPVRLAASARELEQRGMLWRAVEVAALSVFVGGDPGGALARLRRRCVALQSPVVPREGWSALTSREQEIVRLAIAGESDAVIAREIAVSVRTVQTHLSNAYRKLAVTRRSDLGTVLGGHAST